MVAWITGFYSKEYRRQRDLVCLSRASSKTEEMQLLEAISGFDRLFPTAFLSLVVQYDCKVHADLEDAHAISFIERLPDQEFP